jgi:aromatic-amino-acid transaminase
MFETLQAQPADPLLALIGQYAADTRADKVDAGVGVYRDETGQTPIFAAVKTAEALLVERQTSKAYLGPEGDLAYVDRMAELVFAGQVAQAIAGLQTPGGTGALRLAADLLVLGGVRRIHAGMPTWPNHAAIFAAAGLEVVPHPFFDVATQTILFETTIGALEAAAPGDAVLLHASCHNPTGAALTDENWRQLGETIARRRLHPLVDFAYLGFAAGVRADGAGLRRLLTHVPEALVAVSSSKAFGLYRERTGALYAVTPDKARAEIARSNLMTIARTSYSMPPDHGAAVVRTILETPALRQDWERELAGMCTRINRLRALLAAELAATHPALAAVATQTGMFSTLPLTRAAVERLRHDRAIYMPGSGRVNIAGLSEAQVPAFARQIRSAL